MGVIGVPYKRVQRVALTLDRHDRVQRSPYGQVQREVMPGESWRADVSWPSLDGADRREVSAWLAAAARGDVYSVAEPLPGAQSAVSGFTELLANGDFDGTTSWTTSNSTLVAAGHQLRINASGAGDAYATQTVSLTSGRAYALLSFVAAGNHGNFEQLVRDDTAATSKGTVTTSTEGLLVSAFVAAGTNNHSPRLIVDGAAAAGDHAFFAAASFARCALVNGSSQTGRALAIDALPTSTNGILRAGDFVSILTDMTTAAVNPKIELKRLTRDLDSNSSGQGRLYFEPAIRNAPLDNAPVLFHRPRFYSFLPQAAAPIDHRRPLIAALSLTLEEDILAP